MRPPARPRDERWSGYPETVLIFAGYPSLTLELREKVAPAMRDAMASMGLGKPFAVLTAFNPRGVNLDAEANGRRQQALEAELLDSAEPFVRVDACSPDRSHCESSVALMVSRDRALDIARRWEQLAIFWWDGSAFWIHGALSDADPIMLPPPPPAASRLS